MAKPQHLVWSIILLSLPTIVYSRSTVTPRRPDCANALSPFPNVGSLGGIRQSSYNAEDLCKSNCIDEVRCHGIDYNRLLNRCFFHYQVSAFSSTYSSSNLVQFRKTADASNCGNNVNTGTTTRRPNNGGQGNANGGITNGCEDELVEFGKIGAYNGQLQYNVKGLDDCKVRCLAQGACVGLDYLPSISAPSCHLHLNVDNFVVANLYATTTVTQYRRKKCAPDPQTTDCVDRFVKFESNGAYAGELQPIARNLGECNRLCLRDDNCLAYDINDEGSCFLHMYIDFLAQRYQGAGVTHYVRQPCLIGCDDSFTTVENSRSEGGTPIIGLATAELCQSACLGDASCQGMQYTQDKICTIFTDTDYRYIRSQETGTFQYDRNRCEDVCEDAYQIVEEFTTSGGRGDSSETFEACLDKCNKDLGCLALDFHQFDSLPRCFLHFEAGYENRGVVNTRGGNQYRMLRVCIRPPPLLKEVKTTPQPSGCVMMHLANQRINDGTLYSAAKDTNSCSQACADDINCESSTYDRFDKTCLLHTTTVGRHSDPCCSFYEKRCVGCTDTFDRKMNAAGVGAKLVDGVTDVDTCMQSCLKRSYCTSLDFDRTRNQEKCYIFEESNPAIDESEGVDHYTRLECKEEPDTCGYADITILVETTGTEQECSTFASFIQNFGQRADVGQDYNRLAVITYSFIPWLRCDLTDVDQASDLFTCTQNWDCRSSGSKINAPYALKYYREEFLKRTHLGDRLDKRDYLIVLTDGRTNVAYNLLDSEINQVKAQGVTVMSIGVGPGVNMAEINKLASDTKYIYTVNSENALNDIIPEIVSDICP